MSHTLLPVIQTLCISAMLHVLLTQPIKCSLSVVPGQLCLHAHVLLFVCKILDGTANHHHARLWSAKYTV